MFPSIGFRRPPSIVTPTLGTITALSSTTNQTVAPMGNFTPTTGDVALFIFYRNTVASLTSVSAKISTFSFTQRLTDLPPTTAEWGMWIGTIRSLATGSPLAVEVDSSGNIGRVIAILANLSGWTGNIGNSNSGHTYAGTSSTSGPAAALTVSQAGALILGIAGAGSAAGQTASPISASGFTNQAATGIGSGPSSVAALFSKTAGSLGGTETLSPVFSAGQTDGATSLIELW